MNTHHCLNRKLARRYVLPLAALGLMVVLSAGCRSDVAPVSGRVTLNGKPLSGAVVTFQPGGKRGAPPPTATGSAGRTDDEGRYSLRLISPDQPGAVIGEHTVTISVSSGGGDGALAKSQPLPRAWQDGSQRFKVPPGGTSSANFDIQQR